MLPRRQSIFHLGEEGGAAVHHHHHRVGVVVGASMTGVNGRRARERERLVVGLQILVHHQHHHHHHHHSHGRHAHAANIVLKQMVRPRAAAVVTAASRHGHAVSCSFLKACYLCRRDLSPSKDVYMYRGDQGFCSEECRWQQILVDEGRERQAVAVVNKERQRQGQSHHHSPHRTPIRGRPPPRKTLAVA